MKILQYHTPGRRHQSVIPKSAATRNPKSTHHTLSFRKAKRREILKLLIVMVLVKEIKISPCGRNDRLFRFEKPNNEKESHFIPILCHLNVNNWRGPNSVSFRVFSGQKLNRGTHGPSRKDTLRLLRNELSLHTFKHLLKLLYYLPVAFIQATHI